MKKFFKINKIEKIFVKFEKQIENREEMPILKNHIFKLINIWIMNFKSYILEEIQNDA